MSSDMKILTTLLSALCFFTYDLAAQTPCTNAQTLTLRPATEGMDAYVFKLEGCAETGSFVNAVNTNFGSKPVLTALSRNSSWEGCTSGIQRSFIQFNGITGVPPNAKIQSARLILYGLPETSREGGNSYYDGSSNTQKNTAWIQRVTSEWKEEEVTWKNQPSTTTANQVEVPASRRRWNWNAEIDVTQLLKDIRASRNFGFALTLQAEDGTRNLVFASSDHPDKSRHPMLIICYTLEQPPPDKTCVANFSFTINSENPQRIKLQAVTHNSIEKYSWTFGDGTSGTGVDPSHEYQKPGTYRVCLTTRSAGGCTKTECKEIVIKEKAKECYADFTKKLTDEKNRKVEFTALVPANTISYKWDFGDGSTSADKSPYHFYRAAGRYEVCLKIITSNNCEKAVCKIVEIKGFAVGDVYPNPTGTGYVTAVITVPANGPVNIKVLDRLGLTKLSVTRNLLGGTQKVAIDISGLSAGGYTLEVTYSQLTIRRQFLKL
jgi:PKD repeat protein